MLYHRFTQIVFVFLVCLALSSNVSAAEQTNFVFFLVDDMGWADIEVNGSKYHETPNIDKLAASGMRFTNGYAAASICSPTRASIMTGKHPVRVNITDWIPGKGTAKTAKFQHVNDLNQLPLEEVTIAEKLKENGYQTFFAGKWHLGSKGSWPRSLSLETSVKGFVASPSSTTRHSWSFRRPEISCLDSPSTRTPCSGWRETT